METARRVSVVMCTYNGEKFLREQIDSILAQTYPVYELIIQDDCSTDHTVDIIRTYQEQDERVKLYINPSPLGFNYNFSTAFYKASGDYIASSDQDDIWRKDKIEVLINHMRDNCLVFHNSCLFHQDPNKITGIKNADNVPYNELFLVLKPFVPGHECFFKRDILPAYRQIVDKEHNISYDSLVLITAKVSGKVEFINEGLVYWRRHQQATSYDTSKGYSSLLSGLISAIKALANKPKREISARYFKALSALPFREKSTAEIVRLMATGRLFDIFKACRISCAERKLLYPYKKPVQSAIKSCFTPLYFIRDCSKFVIGSPLGIASRLGDNESTSN